MICDEKGPSGNCVDNHMLAPVKFGAGVSLHPYATTYLSGSDGDKYLKLELFEKEGIKIIFQRYKHPEYKQTFSGFHPYMGAIDLLFNHGPESLKILRSEEHTN